jgi:hypothetical protein
VCSSDLLHDNSILLFSSGAAFPPSVVVPEEILHSLVWFVKLSVSPCFDEGFG